MAHWERTVAVRGAPHAQPEAEDEQRVQHQVGQGAQHHGDHSLAGIAWASRNWFIPTPSSEATVPSR